MSLLRGRFSRSTSAEMQRFSSSLDVDLRMLDEDVDGSIVHATMLGEAGVLTGEEAGTLTARSIGCGVPAMAQAPSGHTLVSRGVPFREAHEAVGRLVRWCEERRQARGRDVRGAEAIPREDARGPRAVALSPRRGRAPDVLRGDGVNGGGAQVAELKHIISFGNER